jgi:hypothetical protein
LRARAWRIRKKVEAESRKAALGAVRTSTEAERAKPEPAAEAPPVSEERVETLARIGLSDEEIARLSGLKDEDLSPERAGKAAMARIHGRAALRGKQWDLAMKGDVRMLLWLGKQMLGQSEKGPPIEEGGGVTFTLNIAGKKRAGETPATRMGETPMPPPNMGETPMTHDKMGQA